MRDGAAGLNVTLDGQDKANGLGASFTGQLAQDGTLAGTIASRGPNLAVLLPTPPVPFRADGRLTVRSGLAAVDGLALEIGGSPANGAVALRVAPTQRLDIALAASRLDLDAWLPVLLRAGTTIAGIDVPIGFDFSAEAAPLGGGTLEHVRAAFDLTGKDLVVREASALLPGNGTLRLSGRIARDDPAHPRFDGDARLAAPVLRTTLRWLDAALPGTLPPRLLAALPEGVAQRAELSAHVVAGGDEVVLRRLAGILDDVPISGTRRASSEGNRRPSRSICPLDRLALDPWLPRRLPNPADLSRPVSGLDAELRLNIRQATLAGTTTDGLAVDAAIEAGNILLRRLEGTVRGARFRASGMLGDGGKLSDGKLSVETPGCDRAGGPAAHCLAGDAGTLARGGETGCAGRGTAGGACPRCAAGAGRCAVGGKPDPQPEIGRVGYDACVAPSRGAPTGRDAWLAAAGGSARPARLAGRWFAVAGGAPRGSDQAGSSRTSSS